MKKRILVDMSATLIHHGHIRLLKKASNFGEVIVALTKDQQIKKYKGYNPEIKYVHRQEILESIKYVKKVIPSNFYLDDKYLKKNKIDFLVHGNDNKNSIKYSKLKIFKRTKGISSSILREKVLKVMKIK
jgi:glycerol-3-phosphate cytidylyltransferase